MIVFIGGWVVHSFCNHFQDYFFIFLNFCCKVEVESSDLGGVEKSINSKRLIAQQKNIRQSGCKKEMNATN